METEQATVTTMNSNSHILTRGNKQFELCNHLGNVLVTVQDRKRSVDISADNAADYYLPYLRSVTNYYAFGSAMPGIGGSIKECTVTSSSATLKKYPYYHTFSNDSTSGFTAGSGARTVSNPTHNVLHLESIWSTRPLATKTVYLKNGVNYNLKLNITGFSVVSGYTHTVRVRILLPGSTITNNYTSTGIQTINFTSNTTGNVTVEISSQITGSGSYIVNPYINLDDFSLSWDSAYTAYVNNCNANPENYKYGFNTQEKDNEIAGENNIYTAEYWEYDARIARRWNLDPKLQFDASNYSVFYCNPIFFLDKNGDVPSPKQAAQMSNDVYKTLNGIYKVGESASVIEGGWKLSTRKFGINLSDVSGFNSAVYERVRSVNKDGTKNYEYCYVTQGTDMTSGSDWKANSDQSRGIWNKQYYLSTKNAGILSIKFKKEELSFAGHSLGGGLASANALKTGYSAITFNAAGLHKNSINHYKLYKKAEIIAYVVEGEAVSVSQSILGLKAEGKIIYLKASYIPIPAWVFIPQARSAILISNSILSLNNHRMGVVLDKMNLAGIK